SLTVPPHHVVSTNPPAGNKVSLSTQITLITSGGGVRVPSVINDSRGEAMSALTSAGLIASVVTQGQPAGGTAPPGTVWQTLPAAGKIVLPGSNVQVYLVPRVVSSSPSPPPSSSPSPTPSSPSP